jgi:hypothetical protein
MREVAPAEFDSAKAGVGAFVLVANIEASPKYFSGGSPFRPLDDLPALTRSSIDARSAKR